MEQTMELSGLWPDDETWLNYNRHRYYDPQQGRYITQDPIGLRGGWNLYSYPLNPVTNADPLGLTAILPGPLPLPVPWLNSPEQQAADDNAAKALTNWLNRVFSDTEEKECPPCEPSAGVKFNIDVHFKSHEGRGLEDGSHGCEVLTGSPVHWHYDVNNQNPKTCEYRPKKHIFGSCGTP